MKPAQASSTAKVIAAATILLASEKRHAGCVAPGASDLCRAFLSGCADDRLLAWSANSVDRLFENIRVTPGTSRRVIFSFMRQWPNGGSGFRPHSRIIHFWLAVRGEPFIWTIDPGNLHAFLSARGFDLLEMECAGGSDASLEGENLVVCSNQR